MRIYFVKFLMMVLMCIGISFVFNWNVSEIRQVLQWSDAKSKTLFIQAEKSNKLYSEPIPFEYYEPQDTKTSKKMPPYYNKIEYLIIMELIKEMVKFFTENQIEFYLNFGTLIGSLRHWDKIPWDYDLDFGMDIKYLAKVENLLKNSTIFDWELRELGYAHRVLKLALKPGKLYKLPLLLDIFIHSNDNTDIWFYPSKKYKAPLDTIYPLQLRPFGPLWLPSPNKPLEFLAPFKYGDIYKSCLKYSCAELWQDYAFVTRDCTGNVCYETKKMQNKVLGEIQFTD